MKNLYFILISLFSLALCQQVQIQPQCTCAQMLTRADCERKTTCSWDAQKMTCQILSNPSQPSIEKVVKYCDQFTVAIDCASSNSCEWNGTYCTHFTGCTAYSYTLNDECEKVSARCVTDGAHCVEKDTCSTYKTQTSCKVNKDAKYCYWNTDDAKNSKCDNVDQCSQLPTTLNSDALCRAQLDKCTAGALGGCVESGIRCEDQISELGCVTNKDRSQPCFWKSGQCFDKICDNANSSLKSDSECINFLSTCTTKLGGGCIKRSTCGAATLLAACVKDSNGADCFWNGTTCLLKTCANALNTNTSNVSCQSYLPKCITTGAGCVDNTGCEAAKIKDACDKTLDGTKCHWDGTYCKIKTCLNAGSNYKGHDECTTYLPTCTANGASGCTDRTCTNSPISNNTNDLCKLYYPSGNCVTKNGGGCRINTTCEAIDFDQACVTDVNGKACFWDGTCKTKTCANSPSSNNTHDLCQKFSPACTIGKSSICVDRTCENIQADQDCTIDINNKICIYKGKCYSRQCVLASKSIITHSECQQYLSTCTLDNSGFGCMPIPIQCDAITQKTACVIKANGGKCGLQGNLCMDQACNTTPADGTLFTTTNACGIYKTGCVVNNNLNGCMDLPQICASRKQSENCEIETGINQKCQWDSTNSNCIDIQCINAHIVTLKSSVSQTGCWNYFSMKCVINAAGNGCINRPKSCTGLQENACKQTDVLEGNISCYWDLGSSSCKEMACSNITFLPAAPINHDVCYSAMNSKCTINAAVATSCIALKTCIQYTFREQCIKDLNANECIWTNSGCIDRPCSDAPDSDNYSDTAECQSISKKCTIIYTKCIIKKTACADYQNSAACAMNLIGDKQQCSWNSGTKQCTDAESFNCSLLTGTDLTVDYCQYYNTGCSVNSAGTACIAIQANCSGYSSSSDCKWASIDTNCHWTLQGSGSCLKFTNTKCTDFTGTSAEICSGKKPSCTMGDGTVCWGNCASAVGPYDFDSCQAHDRGCGVKTDGSSCVAVAALCSDFNSQIINCMYSTQGICYKSGSTCTYAGSTSLTSANCNTVSGTRLTASYCKGISNDECSVLADQTACVVKQDLCSGYTSTLANCFSAINETKCVVNAANDACVAFVENTNSCGDIRIYGLTTYTNYHCKLFKISCQKKTDSTGCENDPSYDPVPCSSYVEAGLTFTKCIKKQKLCSVNAAKSACVTAQNTCGAYSLNDCGYAINEGECIVSNGICVQKTCNDAALNITNMTGCQAHSSNCILRAGGCLTKGACSSYLLEVQCLKDINEKDCLWNPTSPAKCVDKICSQAEATTNYDTHDKCAAIGNCTVKATSSKTTGQGCIDRTACSSYTISEQCKLNASGVICAWNTNNPSNPVCAEKSCATASLNTNSHNQCQTYFNNTCTVDIVDVDGTPTPKGCIPLKPCNLYLQPEQCYLSSEMDSSNVAIECGWNGTVCANKSCTTAQSTQNTHDLCDSYLDGCTVNSTDDGCVNIPDQCEGMTKNQCFDGAKDSKNRKCYWSNDVCVTRTCENSPNYTNETECATYLEGCTTDSDKCKTKICEDFPLTTDESCKTALSTCTSNGYNCVSRGTCAQAQTEIGCVTDSQDRFCQWMKPGVGAEYCIQKTCNTAPNTYNTEESCQQYFKPSSGSCTTKKDGGCTLKGACSAATVEAACKTDNNDRCRLKECRDISGTSHAECKKIRSNCTAGLNGKCAQMANCEATTVKAACIVGLNGPCLWISGYLNVDGSKGACFSYESCRSLDWTTDSQCKLISPNCTTNGTECVGITSCAETNITGGCITGTDGDCIQTLSVKGAADTICKKYTSCDAAYYLTHDECNQANPQCTSDYYNGCISLKSCSEYAHPGQCHINKTGVYKDENGEIIATGVCVWDEEVLACKDQSCKDFLLTSQNECAAKMKSCSTDGITCIIKQACNTYTTENACNKAGGLEGVCFWIATTDKAPASCRTKTCSDIQNGTSTAACSEVKNCVSNGVNCIDKAVCASYTTKTGCSSQGTDGICIWTDAVAPATQGKCTLMTGCTSAKDLSTCNLASNRCTWNPTTKACEEYTCETYNAMIGSCTFFYTWDMKKYNICSKVQEKCVSTDAATLVEGDCLKLTGYQYSWNPTSSKCVQCGTNTTTSSNTTNNTNVQNITEYGQIAAWTFVIATFLIC